MTSATGKEKNGFTLIELLVIAVIIAILAGISLPRVRMTYDNFQLESFVKDIYYLCKYLQGISVGETKVYCLNIDRINRGFQAFYKEKTQDKEQFINLAGRFGKEYTAPADVVINVEPAEKEKIYFYPDGSTDNVTLIFINQHNKEIHLNIQGGTGQIIIE